MSKWLIFTDLDGTLLDNYVYSSAVQRMVQRLQAAQIDLIFCSAKTLAEQTPLRDALGLTDPCIVENGSAIIHRDGSREVLGLAAPLIHGRLETIRQVTGLRFQTYQDLSLLELAQLTGLSLEAAAHAQNRDYSATVCSPFSPVELERFQAACADYGLKAPSGGRFYTVTSAGADKGLAVQRLCADFRQQYGEIHSIGIGDSPNDAPMLAAVDYAYQVQNPQGEWHPIALNKLQRVDAIGSLGWLAVMEKV